MSAGSRKPPESSVVASSTTKTPTNSIDSNDNNQQKQIVDCPCTNISIMQLFHEMKQKYPTVPDYIVNQCVTDNCHDRVNCIDCLEKELAAHPNFVQAYPAQVLRKTTNLISKKPLVPTRRAPDPQVGNKNLKPYQNTNDKCCALENTTIQSPNKKCCCYQTELANCDISTVVPQERPKTLNLPTTISVKPLPINSNSSKPLRPVRKAPPPPTLRPRPANSPHSVPSISPKLTQKPHEYNKCGDSEISVNISLSPSTEQSLGVLRHKSSSSVQPDANELYLPNPRSITSVNLTLRKPNTTPQSPIDITVGPGLTYSTSSFDSRRGYQKSFHITVTEGSETVNYNCKQPNYYNMSAQCSRGGFSSPSQESRILTEEHINSIAHQIGHQLSKKTTPEGEHVRKQRISKEHLLKILNDDKRRLERMQREIGVLMTPVSPKDLDTLQNEIDDLRIQCKEMVEQLESAGQFDASTENNNEMHTEFYIEEKKPTWKNRTTSNATTYFNRTEPTLSSPSLVTLNQTVEESSQYDEETSNKSWTCHMCTFRNHHSLKTCEQCGMPQISGSVTNYQSPLSPPSHNNQFFVCTNRQSSDKKDQLIPSA